MGNFFRPGLETLEGREVPSASPIAMPNLGPALVAAAAPQQQAVSIIPLSITGVSIQNGQLIASGLLGNQSFTAPLTLSNAAGSTAATPILDLHLDAIHLNLLGLTVDTSPICLTITAQPGPGNLLGNLLSDVSHLLDQGTSLSTILGGLTGAQQSTLTDGLNSLLNSVFQNLTSPSAVSGGGHGHGHGHANAAPAGNILHLSVGPVDLTLLGLNVHLDNCDNGPVTVDIGAQPGPGNLLGNLLSGITHLLDHNHSGHHLGQLINALEGLL